MLAIVLFLLAIFLFNFIDPAIASIIAVFGAIVWWFHDSRKELTEEEQEAREERKKTIDAGVEVTSFWGDSDGGDGGGACGGACGACGGG